MLLDYNTIILSYIINVKNPLLLVNAKKELIKTAVKLETDDRGYVYVPGEYTVLLKKGHVIAKIANFIHQPIFRLEMAIKQIIHILGHEETNAQKYVLITLDTYDQNYLGTQKGLRADIKFDCNCTFIFCDVGNCDSLKDACDWHPRTKYVKFSNITLMGDQLVELYYPTTEREAIDLEFKAKYGQTPKEATQALQEKYVQNIPSTTNPQN